MDWKPFLSSVLVHLNSSRHLRLEVCFSFEKRILLFLFFVEYFEDLAMGRNLLVFKRPCLRPGHGVPDLWNRAGIVAWSLVCKRQGAAFIKAKVGPCDFGRKAGFSCSPLQLCLWLWLPYPQGGLGKVRTDREAWEGCWWQLVKGCLGIQFLWPTPLSWFCLVLTGLYRKTKTETQGNYEKNQMGCCLDGKSS